MYACELKFYSGSSSRCLVKSCLTLATPWLLCPWDFSGKNTGVDCQFLPQVVFPTQGLNLHNLHWQVDSLQLNHQGSPFRVLLRTIAQETALRNCSKKIVEEPVYTWIIWWGNTYSQALLVVVVLATKSLWLHDPSVHGLSQARILEWLASSFST